MSTHEQKVMHINKLLYNSFDSKLSTNQVDNGCGGPWTHAVGTWWHISLADISSPYVSACFEHSSARFPAEG